MKTYILVVVLLLGTTTLFAQSINWVSMDEALAMQQKAPKKILIDMYTSWCGPCKMLDRNTFTNKDLIAYVNKHYYAVKFNAEGNEVVNFKDQKFTNPNYNPEKAKRRTILESQRKCSYAQEYLILLEEAKKRDDRECLQKQRRLPTP